MKISIDDVELYTLSETQSNVIKYDINSDEFDADMKRRLQWVLTYNYEQSYSRLRRDWLPILEVRYETVPTDPDELATLIFSQPDYKDRKARDEADDQGV